MAEHVLSVLVADDSDAFRNRIIRMLRASKSIGLIKEATNVPGAIDKIQNMKPDVVLLDMQMPGGNGMNVLAAIRRGQHVPIIVVLTNYPHLRTSCLAAGADYFFDKSVELGDFKRLLKKLPPRLLHAINP